MPKSQCPLGLCVRYRIHHVCTLGKTYSSQCRGLTLYVCLFSPPKHKNLVRRQSSLIWTQHTVPCRKLWVLSEYTAPFEKRKSRILAIVYLVRSLMCLLERAKQNCMDSGIWCSLRTAALRSCCSEFFKSTERLFLVEICQLRSSIAWQTGYK